MHLQVIKTDTKVIGASIDVGRVIFDNFTQSVRSTFGHIVYLSLNTICSYHNVTWASNE